MAQKKLKFNVLVENQRRYFIATCLETSLVATSRDVNDVIAKMTKMLVRQVEFALKNDNPRDIFCPAPNEVWEKFMRDEESTILVDADNLLCLNEVRGIGVNQTAYAAPGHF